MEVKEDTLKAVCIVDFEQGQGVMFSSGNLDKRGSSDTRP